MSISMRPKMVENTLMMQQMNDVMKIKDRHKLKEYLIDYIKQENKHPAIIGHITETFYSIGENKASATAASMLHELTPIPTALEYGSSWWNSIGVYLSYPLINIGTIENADQNTLKNVVFSAYTALSIGSFLAKGEAYDTLAIRSKILHKYQRLFKEFISSRIDNRFGTTELYSMIFCDKYLSALLYKSEGLTDNFNKTQESLRTIHKWFLNDPTIDDDPENIFKQGDQYHMKYNPEFVQAYNDREFVFTESSYRGLFGIDW